MMHTPSLRLRLTLIILLPLLAIAAAIAVWATRDAQARAADRFDRSLLVTALGISRDTAISGGDALSRETRDLLRNTSGGPVFYHVYAPDGAFVTGYATPPVPLTAVEGQSYAYFDAQYLGRPVRAVRFSDRMHIAGLSGEFTFTVWQDIALRDGFVQSLSQRTYAVMATLVLGVGLVVWFGVRLGMGPLLDLEQAIAQRSVQDLTPIRRAIPVEVRGIVGRLNNLLSEMSDTIDAKDRFISDAAHQLRNPIAGILALSEAVAASKSEADFKARGADLTEAATHAAKLTEDLLAFERARSSPPIASLPVGNLSAVVANIATRLQPRAAQKSVDLTFDGTSEPIETRFDRVLIEQAIENLVMNALHHGGAALTAITVELSKNRQEIRITVSDNGTGIDPEAYAVATSRFGQITPGKGSGLGLPFAIAVSEAHGGAATLGDAKPGLAVGLTIRSV